MPGTGDILAPALQMNGSVFLEDDSNPASEPCPQECSAQAGSAASPLGLSGSRRDLREIHPRASHFGDDAEGAQNGASRVRDDAEGAQHIFSTFNSLAT